MFSSDLRTVSQGNNWSVKHGLGARTVKLGEFWVT